MINLMISITTIKIDIKYNNLSNSPHEHYMHYKRIFCSNISSTSANEVPVRHAVNSTMAGYTAFPC
jgi:hypothetical protein